MKLPSGESIVKGESVGSDANDRVILLSTNKLMEVASKSKSSGFDCTFCIAPGPGYKQVFIMFCLIGRVYWAPCFYGLLPNKEEGTYRRLYNCIEEAMASVDDPNMPGETLSFCDDLRVMADFEIEERAPWMEIYPSHNMKVSPLISEFLSLISM